MGAGGISIWQLLIILLIVVLLFGTKRLKGIGSDLGNAIKGFRSAMSETEKAEQDADPKSLEQTGEKRVADGDVAKPSQTKAPEKSA
ncbi:twin-arginine translocase subunit TatA [Thiocapsa imhoffii]|uniref:Sec-independent protein translocase protein TatA n=1 Tax=Thiocapsa imhoffii TaxID=382777 RepID=A0A9X0WGJ0_9GAMM|nr:twin-arginine translocase TatA/TatE family subunit [Thiocapsa imhoffii]MBK1644262.1 twin-arginine translocase subunit TatA [Thiocapsa imhoffii]